MYLLAPAWSPWTLCGPRSPTSRRRPHHPGRSSVQSQSFIQLNRAGQGTRQCFSFATKATQQSENMIQKTTKTKHVKALSKWSCHVEYSHNAKNNNFLAWKHGHIVAAVLSRAQLCLLQNIKGIIFHADWRRWILINWFFKSYKLRTFKLFKISTMH